MEEVEVLLPESGFRLGLLHCCLLGNGSQQVELQHHQAPGHCLFASMLEQLMLCHDLQVLTVFRFDGAALAHLAEPSRYPLRGVDGNFHETPLKL